MEAVDGLGLGRQRKRDRDGLAELPLVGAGLPGWQCSRAALNLRRCTQHPTSHVRWGVPGGHSSAACARFAYRLAMSCHLLDDG